MNMKIIWITLVFLLVFSLSVVADNAILEYNFEDNVNNQVGNGWDLTKGSGAVYSADIMNSSLSSKSLDCADTLTSWTYNMTGTDTFNFTDYTIGFRAKVESDISAGTWPVFWEVGRYNIGGITFLNPDGGDFQHYARLSRGGSNIGIINGVMTGWNTLFLIGNSSGTYLYKNLAVPVNSHSRVYGFNNFTNEIQFCDSQYYGAVGSDLLIDDWKLYDVAMNNDQMIEFHQTNNISAPGLFVVDLLFRNGSEDYVSSVLENEGFSVYANITDSYNGSVVTGADCNYTMDINSSVHALFYNASNLLYHDQEIYSFPNAGIHNFSVVCGIQNGSFSDLRIMTVLNIPPVVTLGNVSVGNVSYELINNSFYNYSTASFMFEYSIVDDDIDTIIMRLYNSSELLYSVESGSVIPFNVSGSVMREFSGNPYRFEVFVNDSDADNITSNVFFSVSDETFPICLGFENASVLQNTNYQWDVTCYDESLFSLNVSCNPSYSFYVANLSSYSYVFNDSFEVIANNSCIYEMCDGHTKNKLSKGFGYEKVNNGEVKVKNKDKAVMFKSVEGAQIDVIEAKDRYKFKIKSNKNGVSWKYFRFEGSSEAVFIPSNDYACWIVDAVNGMWFDCNLDRYDPAFDWSVSMVSPGIFDIGIKTSSKDLNTESIGELNCINGSFDIGLSIPLEEPGGASVNIDLEPIRETMILIFLMLLWVVFLVLTLTLKGKNGDTIQFLNIIQMATGFVAGSAWMSSYFLIGFPVIFVALGFFIGLIWGKK